jgi:hypothetical protein
MDDRRFDSLAKSLAQGASRRTVLKGLLGLSGVAVASGGLLTGQARAARRPNTPTPAPIRCPGGQRASGNSCVCVDSNLSTCGPACCNDHVASGTQAYSECCDNACCHGQCYGEELCCAWPNLFCEAQNECCTPDKHQCCGSQGCCDTECCPAANGAALCCEGETPRCCAGDTCIPAEGCCSDAECGGCQSCQDHICVDNSDNCVGCLDCQQGSCLADDASCDDGDPCTIDTCNAADGSCAHTFDCTLVDDGSCCPGERCDATSGGCEPIVCAHIGEACTDPDDCCSKVCTGGGSGGRCICLPDGSLCESDAQCCEGGPCVRSDPTAQFGNCASVCNPVNAACATNGECCSTICSGAGNCICLPDQSLCSSDASCCSGTCHRLDANDEFGQCIP